MLFLFIIVSVAISQNYMIDLRYPITDTSCGSLNYAEVYELDSCKTSTDHETDPFYYKVVWSNGMLNKTSYSDAGCTQGANHEWTLTSQICVEDGQSYHKLDGPHTKAQLEAQDYAGYAKAAVYFGATDCSKFPSMLIYRTGDWCQSYNQIGGYLSGDCNDEGKWIGHNYTDYACSGTELYEFNFPSETCTYEPTFGISTRFIYTCAKMDGSSSVFMSLLVLVVVLINLL